MSRKGWKQLITVVAGVLVIVIAYMITSAIHRNSSLMTKDEISIMIDTRIEPLNIKLESVSDKANKNESNIDDKMDKIEEKLNKISTDVATIKGREEGRKERK